MESVGSLLWMVWVICFVVAAFGFLTRTHYATLFALVALICVSIVGAGAVIMGMV